MKMKNTMIQNLWDSAKAVQGGKCYKPTSGNKLTKIPNKQSNFIPKGNRKRRMNKTQS